MKIRSQTKIVWINRVHSKNFITDFIQQIKNIIGGRLQGYEEMVNDALGETANEFHEKFPEAFNIRVDIEHLTTGAVIVLITGEINNDN